LVGSRAKDKGLSTRLRVLLSTQNLNNEKGGYPNPGEIRSKAETVRLNSSITMMGTLPHP
jgi:hypothetical protein